MATATARRNDSAGKQKGRPATERPFATHFNNGTSEDGTVKLRLQLLAARYGLVGSYAALLASLAFGEAR